MDMSKLTLEETIKRLKKVFGEDFTEEVEKLNEIFGKKKPEEKSDG
jgi:hypothetical protein